MLYNFYNIKLKVKSFIKFRQSNIITNLLNSLFKLN